VTSRVLVALRIAAPPSRVFEAFTAEIGQWWRPDGLFTLGRRPGGQLAIEPGVDGRVLVVHADGEVDEIGRVLTWEPPARLVLAWRPSSFGADEETEVRVRFEPVDDVTRVVVEHLGWDRIPRDHVARHGFPLHPFQQRAAEWWQSLLAALAERSTGG
jgi:uncharacterized protein YndB with AHSA1/START domain